MRKTLIRLTKDIQIQVIKDVEELVAASAMQAAEMDKRIRRVETEGEVDFQRFQDLPLDRWQFPTDVIPEGAKYINPAPLSTYNPRPGIWEAVLTGNCEIVEKSLQWEWAEEYAGDGLSVTLDPTASLSNGSVNEIKRVEEWIKKPTFTDGGFDVIISDEADGDSVAVSVSSSPLGVAIRHNRHDLVKTLLKSRLCNPNSVISYHNLEPNSYQSDAISKKITSRVRKSSTPLQHLPRKASLDVTISPLYFCLMKGYSELVELLLQNPRIDTRIGFTAEPHSKMTSQRCSFYIPELIERETALDNAGPLYSLDEMRSTDWVTSSIKKGRDSHHMQAHSYGIRRD
eukprot:TRINITY_DN17288_c0_g1_i1.p1 TRINITY_DN17288_c0_g1~~TRINITY_DN17288_c0_g1_i1.p1  ORF type:complete len:366 (+),score=74.37 TRINITY_DN17288_c0_g1_i1:71-1099(+)